LRTRHEPAISERSATVRVGRSADVVRNKWIAIVEGLSKTKIADDELARFKAKTKKRFKLAFANSAQLGIALSQYIGAGDWRLLFMNRDRVVALTADQV